jgi:DNA-binding GntR family transcriptional regulator
MDAFDIDRMFDGYVPEEQVAELRAENERLRAALEAGECPTCAERGYDNTDYHRLHRAWCDSVAEIERLRAALEQVQQWTEAYPLDIFPEPNWREARRLLEAGGMTLDSVSAGAMRRVVDGIGKITSAALKPAASQASSS